MLQLRGALGAMVLSLPPVLVITGQVEIFVPYYANSGGSSIRALDPSDR